MRDIVPVWCKSNDNGLAKIYNLPSKRRIKKWQPYDIWDSLSNLFRRGNKIGIPFSEKENLRSYERGERPLVIVFSHIGRLKQAWERCYVSFLQKYQYTQEDMPRFKNQGATRYESRFLLPRFASGCLPLDLPLINGLKGRWKNQQAFIVTRTLTYQQRWAGSWTAVLSKYRQMFYVLLRFHMVNTNLDDDEECVGSTWHWPIFTRRLEI